VPSAAFVRPELQEALQALFDADPDVEAAVIVARYSGERYDCTARHFGSDRPLSVLAVMALARNLIRDLECDPDTVDMKDNAIRALNGFLADPLGEPPPIFHPA